MSVIIQVCIGITIGVVLGSILISLLYFAITFIYFILILSISGLVKLFNSLFNK